MNMKDLYIIRVNEDGPTTINGPFSDEEVLKKISPNPKNEGFTDYGSDLKFLTEIPIQDSGCWMVEGNCIMLLRGKPVVPIEEKVVMNLTLPK